MHRQRPDRLPRASRPHLLHLPCRSASSSLRAVQDHSLQLRLPNPGRSQEGALDRPRPGQCLRVRRRTCRAQNDRDLQGLSSRPRRPHHHVLSLSSHLLVCLCLDHQCWLPSRSALLITWLRPFSLMSQPTLQAYAPQPEMAICSWAWHMKTGN